MPSRAPFVPFGRPLLTQRSEKHKGAKGVVPDWQKSVQSASMAIKLTFVKRQQ